MIDVETLSLHPVPRSLRIDEGSFAIRSTQRILIDAPRSPDLVFSGRLLQRALHDWAGTDCELSAFNTGNPSDYVVVLQLEPVISFHPQGYSLAISQHGATIRASTERGIRYGCVTLGQIVMQFGSRLPLLNIEDWPDFEHRGIMLDVSRDKVPRLETLFALVDLFASWKLNQLQLYTEHTFAYQAHPLVWANASPLTGDEVLQLDAYCRERFIELVPNQNSFGHMERWLQHEPYRQLSEFPNGHSHFRSDGWLRHLAPHIHGSSLCPGDPASLELVRSLLDELLPHFASRQVNVGCDETYELTSASSIDQPGRSAARIADDGAGNVYLDFLLKIHADVRQRGYTMQYWGDIVDEHPELIDRLPKDAIALEWGYEGNHPFDARCRNYREAGIPFYVCPGTSSWGTISGRSNECIANLRGAAQAGINHGAVGYLNTDWGEDGHRQLLPVSYLGFAVGAAFCWDYAANSEIDIPQMLNRHVFYDSNNVLGQLAYDLGNIHESLNINVLNGTVLGARVMRLPLHLLRESFALTDADRQTQIALVRAAIDKTESIASRLPDAKPSGPDGDLIIQEFDLTIRMIKHACLRMILALEHSSNIDGNLHEDMTQILVKYRRLWLARNRSGGLDSSLARLEQIRDEYASQSA